MATWRVRAVGLAALGLAAAAWACGGCAAMPDERRATFGIDFRLPEGASRTGAVVFMLDGVNRHVFNELLDAGRLPNVRKYFVDRGLYVERCAANVPSVTLANETSLVTGLFAGHHGILGNNWFDRTALVWRNYETYDDKNKIDEDFLPPTVFEHLADATTFSLFFQVHRGATKFTENWMSAGPPYFFGWYGFVDRITLWRFDVVAEVARKRGAWPAFTIVYQLAPDMEAYRAGVSSDDYRGALEHADAHIGRVLRDLEAAGLLEGLVLALVSDHGMMDIEHRWDAQRHLRRSLGLSVALEDEAKEINFERRLNRYARYACVTTRGDRYWALHLRKPRADSQDPRRPAFEDWLARPSAEDLRQYPTRDGRRVDLVAGLLACEAVDVVAYRAGDGRVRDATRQGTVELTREDAAGPPGSPPSGRQVACRIVQGNDPLGYAATVPTGMLYGQARSPEVWLRQTADTEYPDLVPQVIAYFDSPRAADLAVFAAPGWNFGFPNKAGHGGLRSTEMYVPLLLAGPGIPHERRPGPVRSVDLMPTLLGLLGRPVPPGLDGQVIPMGR
jgi:hypothetical protein